jgi:hypothetical protein
VAAETREQLTRWMSGMNGHDRSGVLESQIQRRCARVVEENMARGDQFTRMCHAVDDELARIAADASLSVDLLTPDERGFLGLGHRYLPLYDTFQSLRRRLSLFGGKKLGGGEVDFEKRTGELAEVLRRNLDMRFGQATDRIDEIVADKGYIDRGTEMSACAWAPPRFDEQEWAARIRAHIDAWKAESAKQSHAGDVAALTVSAPLLLADILFLGGAGLTLTWAAAWVAGFLGGKGLMRLTQGSPAFNAYQTTVRTYQSFIRESLTEQWEANLDAMPRRHMKMTDPVLEAMMYWSTPGRR